MKRKKEEQALKKTMPKPVVVTKVTKAKPLAKTAAALKETLRVFADKRKKKPLRTIVVQGDPSKITSGQSGNTPLLHRSFKHTESCIDYTIRQLLNVHISIGIS